MTASGSNTAIPGATAPCLSLFTLFHKKRIKTIHIETTAAEYASICLKINILPNIKTGNTSVLVFIYSKQRYINIGTAAIHICDSILSLTIISKKLNGKNIQINPIYTPVTYLFNLQPINIQHNKATKPIIITIFSSLQISTLKLFIIQSFSVLIYSITQACYLLYYL